MKKAVDEMGMKNFKSYSEMIDFLTDKKKKEGRLNKLGEWLLAHAKDQNFWIVEDMKAVMK